MIAGEVEMFYRRVIKDFIHSLGKNQEVVQELQGSNIFLNQIEEKMFQKLQQSDHLLKNLINNYNQIEKEMHLRYSSQTSDPSATPRHLSLISDELKNSKVYRQESSSPFPSLQAKNKSKTSKKDPNSDFSSSFPPSEDIKKCSPIQVAPVSTNSGKQDYQHNFESAQVNLKRAASEYSIDDVSEIGPDHSEIFRRLREDSKIHILATYDANSKRHSFKNEKTEVTLNNVFVKVDGLAREIFLKTIFLTSQKKIHF